MGKNPQNFKTWKIWNVEFLLFYTVPTEGFRNGTSFKLRPISASRSALILSDISGSYSTYKDRFREAEWAGNCWVVACWPPLTSSSYPPASSARPSSPPPTLRCCSSSPPPPFTRQLFSSGPARAPGLGRGKLPWRTRRRKRSACARIRRRCPKKSSSCWLPKDLVSPD